MDSEKYFDRVAKDWDQLQASFFSTVVREKAFSLAKIKTGQQAADIGAGSGFVTEGLLEKGLKVIAVDQSEAMLKVLQEKFSDVQGLECRHGNALDLPINDNSVDYVFANMLLHHVKEPLKGIREMVRILKPRGKLIITDMDKHNFEFLRREQYDFWLGFDRKEVLLWFTEAGLRNIVVESTGESCSSESCTGKENAEIGIFVAMGEKE